MSSYLPAIGAFIHHLAAFTLIGALLVERALIVLPLTVESARRLNATDMLFGIAAGVVLLIGVLRVMYFEKGGSYYLHSLPFLVKLALFALIGLLSIYPTVTFLGWRKDLRAGRVPVLTDKTLTRLRRVITLELVLVIPLLLCAALMARGIGQF
jgi:putative membrane protein